MDFVKIENTKTLISFSAYLAVIGSVLFLFGYFFNNEATIFIGLSFIVLSGVSLYFIYQKKTLIPKLIWGLGTPFLLFVAPFFFTLTHAASIYGYGYLYIAGVMFSSYAFYFKEEKKYLWISIGIYFLGILFYDRVITINNFNHTNLALLFSEEYFIFKIPQLFCFASLTFLVLLLQKNKNLYEDEWTYKIDKLQNLTKNLILSSKNKLIHSGDLLESLEEILRNAAVFMNVSRISIWEVDETKQQLNLIVLYDLKSKSFSYEGTLNCKDFPTYFTYLVQEKIIVADDMVNNPATSEFTEVYTKPLGIKSLMDSPFFLDGKFKGVLCCEEQRGYRAWDDMDQLFSMSISRLISISYYCTFRKNQYDDIEASGKELAEKNAQMASANKKMMEISGELSLNLYDKEEGIKEVKRFIDDMSFRNSHHVRGPLSRILGLLSLYENEKSQANRDEYIKYCLQSANELDNMIREVSVILGEQH